MTIANLLTQLKNIKSSIKTALINKGIAATDDFTTYASLIDNLHTDISKITVNTSLEINQITVDYVNGTTKQYKFTLDDKGNIESIEEE